jgi:hypothetical protein
MGEVITVDFKRKPVEFNLDQYINVFVDSLIAIGLAEEDIDDVVDGITDYEYYKTLDDDLKVIVERYLRDINAVS